MTKDEIQQNTLSQILNHRRCTAGLSVGAGKTKVGLLHMDTLLNTLDIKDIQKPFLLVGPKRTIETTWKDETIKWNLEHLQNKFNFTTYLSLPKQHFNYSCVYFDEVHNLTENHIEWLQNYFGRILGLTGTPPHSERFAKGKIIAQFCPIVVKYKTDDAVEDGILNDYRFKIHLLDMSEEKNLKITTKSGKSWTTSEKDSYDYWSRVIDNTYDYKKLSMARIMRMKAMQTFPTKEVYAKSLLNTIRNKCMLFCNTIEQAQKLCEHSFTSKTQNSDVNLQLFKEGKITKLTSVMQLSEGINIPDLKEGILMHSYSNNVKLPQRLGRILRLSVGEIATCHILAYNNSVDLEWVKTALSGYDENKIEWLTVKK